MRSRSWTDRAALALGAAADSVWCGALAAALTGTSWPALALFAVGVILAGALVVRRPARGGRRHDPPADRGESSSGGERSPAGERVAQLLALGLILGATGALMVAGRAWAHQSLLWQAARDFVYAGGLVLAGISLGRSTQAPDVAVRRAVRGFALLCVILVVAALAGSEPGWAAAAVVASLVAGGLLVAVARYGDLIELVDPAERMPALPWLLAVAGAVLVVVAAGALLSVVLRVDAVLWALHALGGMLRFALDGIAFALGYAGATLARGLAWVLGLFHVHPWSARWTPPQAPKPPVAAPFRHGSGFKFPSTAKLAGTIVGAVLVIGGLLALVVLALRRVRREAPAEASVLEEREELTSLRSAAGKFAGRLGRRLRSRLGGMLRHEPVTPAERVRRRYAELERRLTSAGQPRPAGVTVREYLASVAREGGPWPDASASQPRLRADLAGLYELARYSGHSVDTAQAERFEALALAFGA